MKITVHIEREAAQAYPYEPKRTEVVADFKDLEFTPSLTANFFRALADEIDPRKH